MECLKTSSPEIFSQHIERSDIAPKHSVSIAYWSSPKISKNIAASKLQNKMATDERQNLRIALCQHGCVCLRE